MARVTVEDCVIKVPNRFELVMMAAQRARDITAGATLSVERDDDKPPVVALREIAIESIELESLRNALVKSRQKMVEADEPEEEITDLITGEQAWMPPMREALGDDADLEGEGEEADDLVDLEEDELTVEEPPEGAGMEEPRPDEADPLA